MGGKEEKRRKDEDLFKTVDSVIDSRTYRHLLQISPKFGINSLGGSISSGKEAKVYYARGREKEYAIKIYYTSTASEKRTVQRFMNIDPRFSNVPTPTTRKLISTWAKKEYKNLRNLEEAGVRVPKPYGVFDNILIMEFIGKDGIRAPLLKEVEEADFSSLYSKVIDEVRKMTTVAQLVHGDLSEYNLMIFQDTPVIIDVSQAFPIKTEGSLSFLKRDLERINDFFQKREIQVIEVEKILSNMEIDV